MAAEDAEVWSTTFPGGALDRACAEVVDLAATRSVDPRDVVLGCKSVVEISISVEELTVVSGGATTTGTDVVCSGNAALVSVDLGAGVGSAILVGASTGGCVTEVASCIGSVLSTMGIEVSVGAGVGSSTGLSAGGLVTTGSIVGSGSGVVLSSVGGAGTCSVG